MAEERRLDEKRIDDAQRLELQSMPDSLMALAKDQYGVHFLQFEIWVGQVIDKAFDIGRASAPSAKARSFVPTFACVVEDCQKYGCQNATGAARQAMCRGRCAYVLTPQNSASDRGAKDG